MTRRKFVPSFAAGALAASAQSKPSPVFEIRTIGLRNNADNQRQRLSEFLEHAAVPAFARAGIRPLGFFASSIAEDGPFILTIASYASLAAMEQQRAKVSADAEYRKALEVYNASPGLNYVRIDSMLGRAF